MPRMSTISSIGIGALLSLILCGCSNSETGSAEPTDEPPNPQPSASSAPAGSGETPDSEELEPCSLLSLSDIEEFGSFQPPAEKKTGGLRHCAFIGERQNGESGRIPSIGVGIRESSVGEAVDVGLGVEEATFNSREAALIPDPDGGCIIALALTETSRVDVGVTGIDTEEACQLVEQVTEIVEPRLPGGN